MNVRALQARLAAYGHSPGKVDGAIGPRTYAALFGYVAGRQLGERGTELGRGAAQHFPAFGIETALRLAHWTGQMAHESGGFLYLSELGGETYFHRMYDKAGNRPKVAARLGNVQAGDGVRYHGRGLVQLTGRANYRAAGQRLGLALEAKPELAELPANAVLIACDYWRAREINALADADDIEAVTRAINGGVNGLPDRKRLTARAKAVLL